MHAGALAEESRSIYRSQAAKDRPSGMQSTTAGLQISADDEKKRALAAKVPLITGKEHARTAARVFKVQRPTTTQPRGRLAEGTRRPTTKQLARRFLSPPRARGNYAPLDMRSQSGNIKVDVCIRKGHATCKLANLPITVPLQLFI
ncbi:hypothetical protein MRX96_029251 [Rhipicephalus microplus]